MTGNGGRWGRSGIGGGKCDDWKWMEVGEERDRWLAAIGRRCKCGAPI